MAELTGSEILAKSLKNEGTDVLFFLMGGPILLAESSCIKEGSARSTCAMSNRPLSWGRPIADCCRNPACAWQRAVPG